MEFNEYYNLLREIDNQKNESAALMATIKNLEEIVSTDKKQTVKSRITTSWRSGGDPFGDYVLNLNAKTLLKYCKSELVFQNKKHSILLNRINNERLE